MKLKLFSLLLALSTSYANLSGSTSRKLNGSLALSLDIGDVVRVEMRGPINTWFGLGFGSRIMNGTYSIIATVSNGSLDVEEWTLGPHERGSLVSNQQLEIISDTTNTVTQTRSVIVERPRIGLTYSFPTQPGVFSMIVSYGVDDVVEYAVARNMDAFEAINLTLIGTDAPTMEPTSEPIGSHVPTTPTPAPTVKVKTPKPTNPNTLPPDVMLYASVTFNFEQSVSFYTDNYNEQNQQNQQNQQIAIVMTGPSESYYAIGFGNIIMDGIYAIVVNADGSVSERILQSHAPGSSLQPSLTVILNQVNDIDGVRTVAMTRDTYITNQEYFNFEPFVADNVDCHDQVVIPVIYSHGAELIDLYTSEWDDAEIRAECTATTASSDEQDTPAVLHDIANHFIPTVSLAAISIFYVVFAY